MKKKFLCLVTTIFALAIVFANTACGTSVTVTISQTDAEVIVGKSLVLTAATSDESEITWSSSDKTIATVSAKGVVSGISTGTVIITAASGDATATCTITVKAADKIEVILSETALTVEQGKAVALSASASDGSAITWSSDAPNIATVKDGVVIGVKAGTALISAASGSAVATCTVTVVNRTLAAPSLSINGKTVTVTDPNSEGVKSYLLGFFPSDSEFPVFTVAIINGVSIDESLCYNGEYTVKIRALAADGYSDSVWSADGVNYNVTEGKTKYEIEYAKEKDAVAHPGKWVYWKEQWIKVTKSSFDDGTITFVFSNNKGGRWYNTQLFFKDASLTTDTSYNLTMKIDSTTAGRITINSHIFSISEGRNDISVTYMEKSGNASVSIQLGVNIGGQDFLDMLEGTLVISEITFFATS